MFALFLMSAVFMLPPVYAQNWDVQASSKAPSSKTVTRTVQFYYEGRTFRPTFTFNQADYDYYHSLWKRPRYPADYSLFAAEFTAHPYLLEVIKQLDADAMQYGYTDEALINYLAAFTQAIEYKSDPQNYGYDYPKYPIETIFELGGDCDDKSILLATLLNMYGFDAPLVHSAGDRHMGVAVQRDNTNKYSLSFSYDNRKYALVDATWARYKLGDNSFTYYNNLKFVNIPRPIQYTRPNYFGDESSKNNFLTQNDQSSYTIPSAPSENNRSFGGVPRDIQFDAGDEHFDKLSLNPKPPIKQPLNSGGVPRDIRFDTNETPKGGISKDHIFGENPMCGNCDDYTIPANNSTTSNPNVYVKISTGTTTIMTYTNSSYQSGGSNTNIYVGSSTFSNVGNVYIHQTTSP